MVPSLRDDFNARFNPEKYDSFLRSLKEACGVRIRFRNCETPCFYPQNLIEKMAAYGRELILQLVNNPDYLAAARRAIPPQFNVPKESSHPEFIQVDFGLVRNASGALEPKLVEIQGFPSLYAYQAVLAEEYRKAYALDAELRYLLGGLDPDSYRELLKRAILGDHRPENVVLMEIDPFEQKTLPDFLLTARLCATPIVNVREVKKEGRQLFYERDGRRVPIHRIYNRVIPDELVRKQQKPPFAWNSELDVEWAGHPNWFFLISKFSIPYLRHPSVPATRFLDDFHPLPGNLRDYVLKPLFSFAGCGVIIGPTERELAAIPLLHRQEYILQERLEFAPVIETPCGPTKAETRIMYLWSEELRAGPILVRMGRGAMMGVDYNRDMDWVGSSAGFYFPA